MCKDSRRRMIELETKLRLLIKKKEYKKRAALPDDIIETAAIDYRDKSDDENTNEDNLIDIHWYDKQEAFTAGVKWFIDNHY